MLHVLVAEDDDLSYAVLAAHLGKAEVNLHRAVNGRGVCDTYASSPATFDLILMDIEMPDMNGLQAAEYIRGYERGMNVPPVMIVALTAHDDPDMYVWVAGVVRDASPVWLLRHTTPSGRTAVAIGIGGGGGGCDGGGSPCRGCTVRCVQDGQDLRVQDRHRALQALQDAAAVCHPASRARLYVVWGVCVWSVRRSSLVREAPSLSPPPARHTAYPCVGVLAGRWACAVCDRGGLTVAHRGTLDTGSGVYE